MRQAPRGAVETLTEEEAFDRGRDAYRGNLRRDENPFVEDSSHYIEWHHGWDKARSEWAASTRASWIRG